MTGHPALIGVDWGTSRARAMLLDADGEVVEARAGGGILSVPEGGFPRAFEALCGRWMASHPELPVLLAGMVGSANGWLDAGYVPTPATAADLARALVAVDDRDVFVVPGVRTADGPGGGPDLMRGEETQAMGHICHVGPGSHPRMASADDTDAICLPGTHSKWVEVEDGAIRRFSTHMTGEMYDLWRRHGLLGRLITDDGHHDDAFARGVKTSGEPGGLLHHLFGARALPLADRLPRDGIASWLSGLLLGHECRAALVARPRRVAVIGAGGLTARYARALALLGVEALEVDGEAAAARGLTFIARLAGLYAPVLREV